MSYSEFSPLFSHLCPKQLLGLLNKVPDDWMISSTEYLTLFDLCEIEPDCMNSIFPVLYLSLMQARHEGSSCINLLSKRQVEIFSFFGLSKSEKDIQVWINSLNIGSHSKVISVDMNLFRPFYLITKGNEYYLYLHKTFFAEDKVNSLIKRILKSTQNKLSNDVNVIINKLNDKHSIKLVDGKTATYNDEQKLAIALPVMNSISIITGGPGTGKTFTLTGILRTLLESGVGANEIVLTAPTARAAARMRDTIIENQSQIIAPLENDSKLISIESKTLHRLLGISPFEPDGQYSEQFTLPYKIVIIDEASMIDLNLMKILMNSIDVNSSRLVFMGDKDQLPSVSEGAVLSDLIVSLPKSNIVTLNKSYRSSSDFSKFVNSIRDKQFDQLQKIKHFESVDKFFNNKDSVVGLVSLKEMSHHEFFNAIQFCTNKYFSETILKFNKNEINDKSIHECLSQLNQFKILSLVNNGKSGVHEINRICRESFSRQLKLLSSQTYFKGLPIQILENNDSIEIYNGDLGLCINSEKELTEVSFIKGDHIRTHQLSLLPPSQFGFCTTVHKSQGSEYDIVLLVIPNDCPVSLLNRQLIYTAVSRAKSKCLILSNPISFHKSLNTDHIRETGLLK